MVTLSSGALESMERFRCFGGECAVVVQGRGPAGDPHEAAARARRRLLAWHEQFSRFDPDSELCRLNRDDRVTVPVSPLMGRFLEVALDAARATAGLVDPTLLDPLEAAGYRGDLDGPSLPLADALALAPGRRPAAPSETSRWADVSVDRSRGFVTRPPGVRFDSGGLVKGMFGDVLASLLCGHDAFAVNASGDVRFGGTAGVLRPVQVASPFDGSVLHSFELVRGAAATSGIGRRSWLDHRGLPAHHLLDPASGRPAFTGLVQATALAPTATDAEVLAKAALLSGPERARRWLPHGGLLVYDSGRFEVLQSADQPLAA